MGLDSGQLILGNGRQIHRSTNVHTKGEGKKMVEYKSSARRSVKLAIKSQTILSLDWLL